VRASGERQNPKLHHSQRERICGLPLGRTSSGAMEGPRRAAHARTSFIVDAEGRGTSPEISAELQMASFTAPRLVIPRTHGYAQAATEQRHTPHHVSCSSSRRPSLVVRYEPRHAYSRVRAR